MDSGFDFAPPRSDREDHARLPRSTSGLNQNTVFFGTLEQLLIAKQGYFLNKQTSDQKTTNSLNYRY